MVEISSTGALVPAVKPEPSPESTAAELQFQTVDEDAVMEDADKDMLCPICMQIIKDAFLTACGHSFCYMCIVTHLHNKSNCPCCSHYLTASNMFPNFLLDKVNFVYFLDAIFSFYFYFFHYVKISHFLPVIRFDFLVCRSFNFCLHVLYLRKRGEIRCITVRSYWVVVVFGSAEL